VKTGRTGAQNGRTGARLSAGVRTAKALAVAPRVRVVAEGSRPSKRDEPVATPTPVTLDELTAAKGHAQAMAESLGLSPGSTKIMVASALGTFAGSAMAAKAPAAATVTSTRVGKQPMRPEPRAMAGASSSASEPLGLKGRPRGSQVLVQVAAEYGACKLYTLTFSDVCALATRIMAGTLMVADLQQKNSDGAWTNGIPRSTSGSRMTTASCSRRTRRGSVSRARRTCASSATCAAARSCQSPVPARWWAQPRRS